MAVSRRNVLKGAGALLAAGTGYPAFAQTPAAAADLIVRGATILSMDPAIGDLQAGDIHIRGGVIVRVAPRIDIAGAEVIDATDMIAMPGLVETHWHMWNTLIRNMAGEDEKTGYFPTQGAIGARFTPGDNARGVLLSIAEAIESGITTVHNWSHNLLQPDYADAEIEAMRSTGIRGRFSYGYSRNTKPNDTLPLDDILRVKKKFFDKQGLLTRSRRMWACIPARRPAFSRCSMRALAGLTCCSFTAPMRMRRKSPGLPRPRHG
jgi:5-methylthioadenosine/S-adenosylhomocysteine deaminase